jgi:hypothetical protein
MQHNLADSDLVLDHVNEFQSTRQSIYFEGSGYRSKHRALSKGYKAHHRRADKDHEDMLLNKG